MTMKKHYQQPGKKLFNRVRNQKLKHHKDKMSTTCMIYKILKITCILSFNLLREDNDCWLYMNDNRTLASPGHGGSDGVLAWVCQHAH